MAGARQHRLQGMHEAIHITSYNLFIDCDSNQASLGQHNACLTIVRCLMEWYSDGEVAFQCCGAWHTYRTTMKGSA